MDDASLVGDEKTLHRSGQERKKSRVRHGRREKRWRAGGQRRVGAGGLREEKADIVSKDHIGVNEQTWTVRAERRDGE